MRAFCWYQTTLATNYDSDDDDGRSDGGVREEGEYANYMAILRGDRPDPDEADDGDDGASTESYESVPWIELGADKEGMMFADWAIVPCESGHRTLDIAGVEAFYSGAGVADVPEDENIYTALNWVAWIVPISLGTLHTHIAVLKEGTWARRKVAVAAFALHQARATAAFHAAQLEALRARNLAAHKALGETAW